MDQVVIRDLHVRGIIGINPDERKNRQDILINIVMEVDTRAAAESDSIDDAVNYRSVAKAVIAHVESREPLLVERLAQEIADICFATDSRVQGTGVTVEKPGAVRFARSVGITIHRTREEFEASTGEAR